jgi:hypothetical protein
MQANITITHTNSSIPVLNVNTSLRPAIALQVGDFIDYTYNYTATVSYIALSETGIGS